MAKSVERPVSCSAPCEKLVVVPATLEPRPTWAGLVPPVLALAAPPPRRVWLSTSWNTVVEDLKPEVLTLAMLLPTTSIIVWWLRRPDTAENMERIMAGLLASRSGWDSRSGCGSSGRWVGSDRVNGRRVVGGTGDRCGPRRFRASRT